MKYIVIKHNEIELLFIFPRAINHSDFLESVLVMRTRKGIRDWERMYKDAECISAGFVDFNEQCYGESTSIGVKARYLEDTQLLRNQKVYG